MNTLHLTPKLKEEASHLDLNPVEVEQLTSELACVVGMNVERLRLRPDFPSGNFP